MLVFVVKENEVDYKAICVGEAAGGNGVFSVHSCEEVGRSLGKVPRLELELIGSWGEKRWR